jgi:transposase
MVLRAPDCDNGPVTCFSAPRWNENSGEWLAIDRHLAPDHPARRIARLVDELDLTELRQSYAGRGTHAHPPVLLLRLVLYECWKGEPSPAQWHRDAQDSEAAKWLLFGLEPSRSCLYAFRDRCAPWVDNWNRQILQFARAEGLITGDDVALDGTFVAARGSRHRLLAMKSLNKRLDQLDAAVAADYAPADRSSPPVPADTAPATASEKPAYWMAKTPATRLKQRSTYRSARETLKHKIQCHQRTLSRQSKSKRRPAERIVICPTEREAALGRDKLKTFRPLYNVQYARAINGPFVLGYHVVAETNDAGQFGPLLERVKALSGCRPKRATVDQTYAGPVDLALARELGIVVYAPTSATKAVDGSRKKPNQGLIPKQEFVWLPHDQTYCCPQGHLLDYVRSGTETRRGGEALKLTQYRCAPEHCRECPMQIQCTRTPERGRLVKRTEHDDLVEDLQKRMEHPESQEFYRQRKQTVELSYADLKEHRGLRQFHGFGLIRAQAQIGATVLAVNGMALVKLRTSHQPRTRPDSGLPA